jgi:hypothetical protein
MSTNKLNELTDEELLSLAQETRELPKDSYNFSKTSVENYLDLSEVVQSVTGKIYERIPTDLAYRHYIDWMKENFPAILPHDLNSFRNEMIKHCNHMISGDETYYFLIRYTSRYYQYADHPWNKERKRRAQSINTVHHRKKKYREKVKKNKELRYKQNLHAKSQKRIS